MTNIINPAKHWRIALYGRVSTSLQEDQKTIQNQIMAITDWLDKTIGKDNYTIVGEYLDEGWSGDVIERPKLDQLRIDAKNRAWDAVVVYDPDRLSRRSEWQAIVKDEIEELGISMLFVTVPEAKTDEDKIMGKMRGVFAEYERMKIKERFRLGKLRKVREGNILTSEALYGYTYIRNNKETKVHGYYVINEEEARVVRMIFVWVGKDGLTIRQVVRSLQELGIKPRRSKRGVWNTSTLTTMLRHRGYIGEAHWGSSYAVIPKNPIKTDKYRQVKKTSRKMKPREDWIAANIKIPKIIEPELYEKVQVRLKKNSDYSKRNAKNEYLLGGKIYCPCGSKRCGEGPQHGKHLYYRCANKIYSFPLPRTCDERGINARIADKLVWQELIALVNSSELLIKQRDLWLKSRENTKGSMAINLDSLKSEIVKMKAQVEKYNNIYANDMCSFDQLRAYTNQRNSRINELIAQITEVEQKEKETSKGLLPRDEEIKLFTDAMPKDLNNLSFEARRAMIRASIWKIIGTQRELQVIGNIHLAQNYVEYKTDDRNCWTTKCREKYAFQCAHT